MRKGLHLVLWIFAAPFLLVGALWIWRNGRRTASAAVGAAVGAASGSQAGNAAKVPVGTQAGNAATPVTNTLQDIDAVAKAATPILQTVTQWFTPSNNDYSPDASEPKAVTELPFSPIYTSETPGIMGGQWAF